MNCELTHQVYLGLGANLGDREATICQAYRHIERLIGAIRRQSAFYYSEPWGFESENSFVNSVVCVETTLTPRQVLHRTKLIERHLGKKPQHASDHSSQFTVHSSQFSIHSSQFTVLSSHLSPLSSHLSVYHDRPIDIDILLYDDLHINEPDLVIPHPLMQQRDFVMVPLREIL